MIWLSRVLRGLHTEYDYSKEQREKSKKKDSFIFVIAIRQRGISGMRLRKCRGNLVSKKKKQRKKSKEEDFIYTSNQYSCDRWFGDSSGGSVESTSELLEVLTSTSQIAVKSKGGFSNTITEIPPSSGHQLRPLDLPPVLCLYLRGSISLSRAHSPHSSR